MRIFYEDGKLSPILLFSIKNIFNMCWLAFKISKCKKPVTLYGPNVTLLLMYSTNFYGPKKYGLSFSLHFYASECIRYGLIFT